jgi:hypothetical protein
MLGVSLVGQEPPYLNHGGIQLRQMTPAEQQSSASVSTPPHEVLATPRVVRLTSPPPLRLPNRLRPRKSLGAVVPQAIRPRRIRLSGHHGAGSKIGRQDPPGGAADAPGPGWRDHKFAKVRADSACPIGAQNRENVIDGDRNRQAEAAGAWPVAQARNAGFLTGPTAESG